MLFCRLLMPVCFFARLLLLRTLRSALSHGRLRIPQQCHRLRRRLLSNSVGDHDSRLDHVVRVLEQADIGADRGLRRLLKGHLVLALMSSRRILNRVFVRIDWHSAVVQACIAQLISFMVDQ